jgi:SRSO17 transposase
LRERLHDTGLQYVLSVSAETTVFAPGTAFELPERKGTTGRPRGRLRPDGKPVAIGELIAGLHPGQWQTVAFRDGPDGELMTSRFAFVRVRAAHRWQWGFFATEPREEWLICEWPEGAEKPTDYWLSNLPADTPPERLARLARLRWKIELDYKQLKSELGLDHYEGRSYLGWYHHTALVTAAHGFLTLERLHPFRQRPA